MTGAVIDDTNTLNPGDAAQASVSWDGASVRFTFGIPGGQEGQAGQAGAPGPPFTNFQVDGVNTLNPSDNATVQTTFEGSNVCFTFGIPRSLNGNDGGMGAQGTPGEVTSTQLNSAIAGSSSNSNTVAALSFGAAPSYDAAQQQDIIGKVNELISALRR